ncbi:MAG: hypothetical protein PWP28_2009 [Oceanotoga sp.]|nr:hypothetical protein [Oceanotoga sp.]
MRTYFFLLNFTIYHGIILIQNYLFIYIYNTILIFINKTKYFYKIYKISHSKIFED